MRYTRVRLVIVILGFGLAAWALLACADLRNITPHIPPSQLNQAHGEVLDPPNIPEDTEGPVISQIQPAFNTGNTAVTISWTTDEKATSFLGVSDAQVFFPNESAVYRVGEADVDADKTSHSVTYTFSDANRGKTYWYWIVAKDSLGNTRYSDICQLVADASYPDPTEVSIISDNDGYGVGKSQSGPYNYHGYFSADFNGTQYGVAWLDQRYGGTGDLYFRLLDIDGTPSMDSLRITQKWWSDRYNIHVAGSSDYWLIIWSEEDGWDTLAVILDATGNAVADTLENPVVLPWTNNGIAGHAFKATWNGSSFGVLGIQSGGDHYYTTIQTDGTLGFDPPVDLTTLSQPIPNNALASDLYWDPANSTYIITYLEPSDAGYGLYINTMSTTPDTTVYDTPGFYEVSNVANSPEAPLIDEVHGSRNIEIISNGKSGADTDYYVLYQDDGNDLHVAVLKYTTNLFTLQDSIEVTTDFSVGAAITANDTEILVSYAPQSSGYEFHTQKLNYDPTSTTLTVLGSMTESHVAVYENPGSTIGYPTFAFWDGTDYSCITLGTLVGTVASTNNISELLFIQ